MITNATERVHKDRRDAHNLKAMLPYLWEFRGRVALAIAFLVTAKLANLAVPLLMKEVVDGLSGPKAVLAVPVALLVAYGLLRMSSTLFNELRDVVFVKVAQRAMRRVALEVFEHMHALSLRFHLERQTGGLTRDIERGTRGISTLLNFMVFSVLPTLFEIALVTGFLIVRFDVWFGVITVGALVLYVALTFAISEWRIHHRRTMNEMDSKANTRAIDSLLNYETVKYFGNEGWEARRYDESLKRYESAVVMSETSLGILNTAQAAVIAVAVSLLMWRAADGIVHGGLTLGDLVMVNALLIQLYIPLNFLGVLYREIKTSLTDMEKMFRLLAVNREVEDRPGAPALRVQGGAVRFESVGFSYDGRRTILEAVDFEIPAGHTVAVVGASGSGKSTLARLLYRFYDVNAGRILVDGQDVREVTQASLRAALGIVPQDTVLFNDTIYYNIAYGRPGATREEVVEAARLAHILGFIEGLPDGWETTVGERGLKLSGGEKQRVSIARTLLKNPPVMIFDEATSSLDSQTEQAIGRTLAEVAENHTTLVIAHRLSTVVDADQILVLEAGRLVEQGSHRDLLAQGGRYAAMWELQRRERERALAEARGDSGGDEASAGEGDERTLSGGEARVKVDPAGIGAPKATAELAMPLENPH
jgi:ABC-type transport system involved in Fe-S cluster assembly fused permease/ATPase subunit